MMLASASCVKDTLYAPAKGAPLTIEFDWRNAPEGNPAGITLWFYDLDQPSLPPVRFDVEGKERATVEIAAGRYNVVAYNGDSEATAAEQTESYHTHMLTSRPSTLLDVLPGLDYDKMLPRPAGTEDEPIVAAPEPLWGCCVEEVKVRRDNGIAQTLTLPMRRLTYRYTFEIRNIAGLENVTHLCAAITGMAPSISLHDMRSTGKPGTIPLEASIVDSTTIRGEFHTFGRISDTRADEIHLMGLYMWLKGGSTYTYGMDGDELFDITDQLLHDPGDKPGEGGEGGGGGNGEGPGTPGGGDKPAEETAIHIEIEGIELPPVPVEGETSGDINDWEESEGGDMEAE